MKLVHRLVFFFVFVPVGLAVVVFGILNRDPVEVDLFVARLSLPLSLGILGGLAVGVLVGLVIAWFSTGGWRRRARLGERRVTRLEEEVAELRHHPDVGHQKYEEQQVASSGGGLTRRRRALLNDS